MFSLRIGHFKIFQEMSVMGNNNGRTIVRGDDVFFG